MAKEEKKEKPTGWNFDLVEALVVLIFLLAIAASISAFLHSFFGSGEFSSEITFYGFKLSGIFDFFKSNIDFFKALGFVLAGASAIGTFVFNKMADAVVLAEKAKLFPKDMPIISGDAKPSEDKQNGRWKKILELSESQNSSDWRLSIIEADIILDELLEKLHLPGETMGEKLKAVEKSDFTTIESAWEAHKARNMIAHEGNNFLLSQRETRRIVSLYEAVFKEFSLI